MSGCCDNGCEITARNERQRSTLKWVLVINALMFLVIVAAALYADSTALLSDSLDNLGDAITYALSLYAIALGSRAKARVALFKGILILAAALAVAGQIAWKLAHPALPIFEAMGAFSLLGLTANGICFWLLWRHRHEDINMSSVWECSRNDIASNIAVFVAALGVWLTGAAWPDLLVAAALVVLLLRSALRVISSARRELAP
ncbi:MAG TPA: cation transporter [Gallionellaceae bacterium]|nr:cation transporter [Gallionellaceae bacterium]